MTNLIGMKIIQTQHSPLVELDHHLLRIEGECRPENAAIFFDPICDELKEILSTRNAFSSPFKVSFKFRYISSSSMLYLKKLFLILKNFQEQSECEIIWNYETMDADMSESAEALITLTQVKMNLIPYN